ncbi:MAG: class I SAM-dependent methyltransferase [Pyrinomonadaceae bacterium]|nr:class I SAM-dependent methyltransferase [Pyrinomonadaceae bacterium]MCX7639801.1 class I SAM-dependent methyltransferase [Pyrinomonadaceae bacterium]MDW8304384.1 class I SAM-dependent methyltransferase [Acidobacteriota bacterium]
MESRRAPLRTTKDKTKAFYDQIADVQPFMQKIMGYRASLSKYLRSLELKIDSNSIVMDAGCGTGLATFSLYSAGYCPKIIYALDLSFNSLKVARQDFKKDKQTRNYRIEPIQGDLLCLPFGDETFDFVITCGALEYVPLRKGLEEIARVLKPKAKMILIPVCTSPVSAILEVIYKFKAYTNREIKDAACSYFRILKKHKFSVTEPIGWSKNCFLLEKK